MKWQVDLAPAARSDIETALDQTLDRFGRDQHDRYEQLIETALAEIAIDPRTFRSTAHPKIHPDVRSLHIGRRGQRARHLLVYRIDADGVIRVARFLHDAMEVRRHVAEESGSADVAD